METLWIELAAQKCSKMQRHALHKFFGLYSQHPQLVSCLTETQADALLSVFVERAKEWKAEEKIKD